MRNLCQKKLVTPTKGVCVFNIILKQFTPDLMIAHGTYVTIDTQQTPTFILLDHSPFWVPSKVGVADRK